MLLALGRPVRAPLSRRYALSSLAQKSGSPPPLAIGLLCSFSLTGSRVAVFFSKEENLMPPTHESLTASGGFLVIQLSEVGRRDTPSFP